MKTVADRLHVKFKCRNPRSLIHLQSEPNLGEAQKNRPKIVAATTETNAVRYNLSATANK